MLIAAIQLDARTDARRELKSLAAKRSLTSEPVYAEKNGTQYMLVGVEHASSRRL